MSELFSEKYLLIGSIIYRVFAVLGVATVVENHHPYLALFAICVSAGAGEYVIYVEKSKNAK